MKKTMLRFVLFGLLPKMVPLVVLHKDVFLLSTLCFAQRSSCSYVTGPSYPSPSNSPGNGGLAAGAGGSCAKSDTRRSGSMKAKKHHAMLHK